MAPTDFNMKNFALLGLFMIAVVSSAQTVDTSLPYYELPEYSENFTAGTVAARQVDALGFRYYWATSNLVEKDLAYKSDKDARSVDETIEHILSLSYVIVNSTLKKSNEKTDFSQLDFEAKRKQTLINLKTAADLLRQSDDISQFKIIFGEREVPFWNAINGPIADAIWHCGQIASFRRITGNPINPNVNHFMGTVKE